MYSILIVDDERTERQGIANLIRRYQYPLQIQLAASGREALELIQREPVDILLTDIKMPFMTGFELIEAVLGLGKNPICIIYSAYSEFEYAKNAIQLGVLEYLLKPIKLEDFQSLFDKVFLRCDEKKAQQEEAAEVQKTLQRVEDEKRARQLLQYLENDGQVFPSELMSLLQPTGCFPLVLSGYSDFISRYWERYEQELRGVFGEDILIVSRSDTQFAVFIPRAGLSSKKLAGLCRQMIDLTRKNYQSEVFIVAGSVCSSVKGLKREYLQLCEQLDYQFFTSGSLFILCEENGIAKKTGEMLPLYFERILTYAKLKNYPGMREEFGKAFAYVEAAVGFSSVYIKYNFSDIIKRCCEVLHSEERMLQIVEEIYGSTSMAQVKTAVFNLIAALERNDRQSDEGLNRLVGLTKQIIRDRFGDYSLNVSSIAGGLGVSAAYLSTLFKAETSQNLVKYISSYRIEKAKELLSTTNLRVSDIAGRVGYMNSSYFIALFRNNVGCSPAKYREKVFRND